jgi:glucose-1-phosphate cytidylyltransferase
MVVVVSIRSMGGMLPRGFLDVSVGTSMKVAILAGGLGTRLAEETVVRPKPMVEIGGRPILWHVMSIYAAHGFREFVVALGYKGEVVKEYFANFRAFSSDLTVDLASGKVAAANSRCPDWTVQLVDTGAATETGGRVLRLKDWIGNETFMLTYGDGVADVDIKTLVKFHRSQERLATVTAVRPPARFGALHFEEDRVTSFSEKPQAETGWINGGFFVLEPGVFDYIEGDRTIWERRPLERLAAEGQLAGYRHDGFWQPMDTLREKRLLEGLWLSGNAPWKVW